MMQLNRDSHQVRKPGLLEPANRHLTPILEMCKYAGFYANKTDYRAHSIGASNHDPSYRILGAAEDAFAGLGGFAETAEKVI